MKKLLKLIALFVIVTTLQAQNDNNRQLPNPVERDMEVYNTA